MLSRLKACLLLTECSGVDIWSVEHCQLRGVPESWIAELSDCFESGFTRDRETIYVANQATNQYRGVRDVDLALKLGAFLGVNVDDIQTHELSREQIVRSIQDCVEEG